jgi:hypothetical protein
MAAPRTADVRKRCTFRFGQDVVGDAVALVLDSKRLEEFIGIKIVELLLSPSMG